MNTPHFPLSTFKNIRDTTPILHSISPQRLTIHKIRPEKDGPVYSPAIWRKGSTRGSDGIDYLTAVVLDYDGDGADLDDCIQRLAGYEVIYHTTHSNQPNKPKFRIVLPLSEPATLDNWQLIHHGATELAGGNGLDPTCAEASRAYYAPSCPEEYADTKRAGHQEGQRVTTAELLKLATECHPPVEEPRIYGAGKPGDDFNEKSSWSEVLAPHGWHLLFEQNGTGYWQKPAGCGREHHATTNHAGSDCMYVFTPLTDLPQSQGLTKFAVYTYLNHGGNFKQAAKALSEDGYGGHKSLQEKPSQSENIRQIKVVDVQDFLALDLPPRKVMLEPWLPEQGLAMIFAPRGIGKTHLTLGIGYAVASGGEFLNWSAPEPKGVLLLDGEMPANTLQERLARIAVSHEKEPVAPLRIVTPDLQKSGMINLSSIEDQVALEQYLDGISLIIVDNLSTLCRSGRENEAESWLPVQAWGLQQRAVGRSVLFIHHSGKNGEQRGTSRREDVLDTVLKLKLPGDYTPDKGANFEVHFVKARGIFGDDTRPFEAQLSVTPDGKDEWLLKSLEQSTAEKVADLLNEGIPQNEIPEMLGLSKGAVSKAKKKAQNLGLLTI